MAEECGPLSGPASEAGSEGEERQAAEEDESTSEMDQDQFDHEQPNDGAGAQPVPPLPPSSSVRVPTPPAAHPHAAARHAAPAAAEAAAPVAHAGCPLCAHSLERCARCQLKAKTRAQRAATQAREQREAARRAVDANVHTGPCSAALADGSFELVPPEQPTAAAAARKGPPSAAHVPAAAVAGLAAPAPAARPAMRAQPPAAATTPAASRASARAAATSAAATAGVAVPRGGERASWPRLGGEAEVAAVRALLNARALSLQPQPAPDPSLQLEAAEGGAVGAAADCEAELRRLLLGTLCHGENQSVLIVGPRASGKARLVRGVLQRLRSEEADSHGGFQLVQLSGRLQKDDAASLLEVARQLSLEAQLDAHLASLSANGSASGGQLSVAAGLRLILTQLRAASAARQSVVFVLHHFEALASRAKQSLLYSLLDLAQSAHCRLALIGLCTRLDVLDSLEKRVRSRFSGRLLFTAHLCAQRDVLHALGGLLSLPSSAPPEHGGSGGGGQGGADADADACAAALAAHSAPSASAQPASALEQMRSAAAAARTPLCAWPPFLGAAAELRERWHGRVRQALHSDAVRAWAARLGRVGCSRKDIAAKVSRGRSARWLAPAPASAVSPLLEASAQPATAPPPRAVC